MPSWLLFSSLLREFYKVKWDIKFAFMHLKKVSRNISCVLTRNNTLSRQNWINPSEGQNCTKTGQETQLLMQMHEDLVTSPMGWWWVPWSQWPGVMGLEPQMCFPAPPSAPGGGSLLPIYTPTPASCLGPLLLSPTSLFLTAVMLLQLNLLCCDAVWSSVCAGLHTAILQPCRNICLHLSSFSTCSPNQ